MKKRTLGIATIIIGLTLVVGSTTYYNKKKEVVKTITVENNKIINKTNKNEEEERKVEKLKRNEEVKEIKKDYTNLKNQLNEYISKEQGRYGIYFISLNNGQEFGINADEEYIAASTIKLPVNLYLYNLVAEGKIDMNEKVTYKSQFYEEGTGDIQGAAEGTQYTIRQLSEKSITISDNIAVNMLISRLGWNEFHEFQDSISGLTSNKSENNTNPKLMAYYLKWLVAFSEQHPEQGKEILGYLKSTDTNNRIPAKLPKEVQVAHKIGSYPNVINDVGIVYGQKPFIIAVLSKNINDEERAAGVIANITKMVYDYEQSQ